MKVSGPKGNDLTAFSNYISGTSHSLGNYYFDSNNSSYAGVAGNYTVALWIKDAAGNTESKVFGVTVGDAPDTSKPYFSGTYLSSSVTKPSKIYFSGNAYDDKGLSIVTMKISGPKGNDLTAFSNNISGTNHYLGNYYFDSNNSYYAGVTGYYTVALWIKDIAGNTESKVFSVQVK
jgi:hypothetical protein